MTRYIRTVSVFDGPTWVRATFTVQAEGEQAARALRRRRFLYVTSRAWRTHPKRATAIPIDLDTATDWTRLHRLAVERGDRA